MEATSEARRTTAISEAVALVENPHLGKAAHS